MKENIHSCFTNKKIEGYGYIEENVVIRSWKIRGFFSLGAFTLLEEGSHLKNALVGKFSRIGANVIVGGFMGKENLFSNSGFAYAEQSIPDDNYTELAKSRFYFNKAPITTLGNDVWLQNNVIVKAGVAIGDGVIVYPNSVVVDDLPAFSICAGNPAKVIGYRFEESIQQKISQKSWWNKNIFEIKAMNFSDIESILELDLNPLDVQRYFVDSSQNYIVEDNADTVLIGPSHVQDWRERIRNGELITPSMHLVGFSGLSLYDKSIYKLFDYFSHVNPKKIIFMVPDFRIGNSELLSDKSSLPGAFIDKNLINYDSDNNLYVTANKILNEIVEKYPKIKYLFWCLGLREFMNISKGKYLTSAGYSHPIWNLSDLESTYSENVISLGVAKPYFSKLIKNDGTVHPTNLGYKFIEALLYKKTPLISLEKYKPTILIRTYRWDEVNNALARFYKDGGADVYFVVDETKKSVQIPKQWGKISITKEKLENYKLRYQEDVMWRCGDYCYYIAFLELENLQSAWLVEDEALIYSKNIKDFLFKFDQYNFDFLAGKFGPRGKNNYLYKAISYITEYPYGCIFSVSKMSRDYGLFLYKQRIKFAESFKENLFSDDMWTNDEYFSVNMSVGEKFVVGALQDVERWCCSETLHFSSQKVLMQSELPFDFKYNDRFYHPILINGLTDIASMSRNGALLQKQSK